MRKRGLTAQSLNLRIVLLKREREELEAYADFPEALARINAINAEIARIDADIKAIKQITAKYATKEVA